MTEDDTDIDEIRSEWSEEGQSSGHRDVDWESVATDPTPDNLGYEASEWERIPVTDDDQVIFLPGNEEDLEDDAFVVLPEEDLCDLVTRR